LKTLRAVALAALALVTIPAVTAEWFAPAPYDRQFRDAVLAALRGRIRWEPMN
jgi:hypothetical protein